tara:strand:+ start:1616 stop:1996 length:381 start_codon:yes stop_codon:yes gene_type:complete
LGVIVTKDKGGRPKKPIDYTKLDAMCAIHCTGEECAAILGVSYEHLNNQLKRDGNGGFLDYFKVKGSNGKMSLRRKQYDQAMSGNATMLIWLGKQWLNQSDKMEQDIQSDNKITNVKIEVISASKD